LYGLPNYRLSAKRGLVVLFEVKILCFWKNSELLFRGGLAVTSKVAVVTYAIIAINIFVFLQGLSNPEAYNQLILNYGLVPEQIMQGKNILSLVTSMFLHADIIHLAMNMFFLLISGDAVERELGNARFLGLYFACGIIAGLFHAYLNSASAIPTIGASGAIFGVLAAFAILFPFRWLLKLFGFIPIPMPAIIFVFITILLETAYVSTGTVDSVAHAAHVGGFLSGIFLTLLFIPRKRSDDESKQKTSANQVHRKNT
jgi:membrane associated rhomboid family serine protease